MGAVQSKISIRGKVSWLLRGPDGRIKRRGVTHNLVTDVGDQYLATKIHGAPTVMDDMKLGTATTAVTKSGAGSFVAVADYISGSAHACDNSTPKQGATADIVQYEHTWAAGEATNATINRVGIVDNTTDAGEGDATHTLAIALLDPKPVAKGAADTLKVTWDITFLGA